MKKLFSIMILLSGMAFLNCSDNTSPIDMESLFAITTGFNSSYMSFQITDGPNTVVETVPEYVLLNETEGLTSDGTNYSGVFAKIATTLTQSASIVLPSPAEGAVYLEDSPNLFTYTRGATIYTIDTASAGNGFRIDITEWNGARKYMEATFSGIVCNGSSTTDCLTIESGVIHALVR